MLVINVHDFSIKYNTDTAYYCNVFTTECFREKNERKYSYIRCE